MAKDKKSVEQVAKTFTAIIKASVAGNPKPKPKKKSVKKD